MSSNPLLEDVKLKNMLKTLPGISTEKEFRGWRQEFLDRLDAFLDEHGTQRARKTYAKFSKSVLKLVRIILKLKSYVDKGDIGTDTATVMARRCISELSAQITVTLKEWEALVPATGQIEKELGYTKFNMGAVLVRDSFSDYTRLSMCSDSLIRMRLLLQQVANRQILAEMEQFGVELSKFCDLMSDLGLYDVMMKSRQLAEETDLEDFVESNPKEVPEQEMSSTLADSEKDKDEPDEPENIFPDEIRTLEEVTESVPPVPREIPVADPKPEATVLLVPSQARVDTSGPDPNSLPTKRLSRDVKWYYHNAPTGGRPTFPRRVRKEESDDSSSEEDSAVSEESTSVASDNENADVLITHNSIKDKKEQTSIPPVKPSVVTKRSTGDDQTLRKNEEEVNRQTTGEVKLDIENALSKAETPPREDPDIVPERKTSSKEKESPLMKEDEDKLDGNDSDDAYGEAVSENVNKKQPRGFLGFFKRREKSGEAAQDESGIPVDEGPTEYESQPSPADKDKLDPSQPSPNHRFLGNFRGKGDESMSTDPRCGAEKDEQDDTPSSGAEVVGENHEQDKVSPGFFGKFKRKGRRRSATCNDGDVKDNEEDAEKSESADRNNAPSPAIAPLVSSNDNVEQLGNNDIDSEGKQTRSGGILGRLLRREKKQDGHGELLPAEPKESNIINDNVDVGTNDAVELSTEEMQSSGFLRKLVRNESPQETATSENQISPGVPDKCDDDDEDPVLVQDGPVGKRGGKPGLLTRLFRKSSRGNQQSGTSPLSEVDEGETVEMLPSMEDTASQHDASMENDALKATSDPSTTDKLNDSVTEEAGKARNKRSLISNASARPENKKLGEPKKNTPQITEVSDSSTTADDKASVESRLVLSTSSDKLGESVNAEEKKKKEYKSNPSKASASPDSVVQTENKSCGKPKNGAAKNTGVAESIQKTEESKMRVSRPKPSKAPDVVARKEEVKQDEPKSTSSDSSKKEPTISAQALTKEDEVNSEIMASKCAEGSALVSNTKDKRGDELKSIPSKNSVVVTRKSFSPKISEGFGRREEDRKKNEHRTNTPNNAETLAGKADGEKRREPKDNVSTPEASASEVEKERGVEDRKKYEPKTNSPKCAEMSGAAKDEEKKKKDRRNNVPKQAEVSASGDKENDAKSKAAKASGASDAVPKTHQTEPKCPKLARDHPATSVEKSDSKSYQTETKSSKLAREDHPSTAIEKSDPKPDVPIIVAPEAFEKSKGKKNDELKSHAVNRKGNTVVSAKEVGKDKGEFAPPHSLGASSKLYERSSDAIPSPRRRRSDTLIKSPRMDTTADLSDALQHYPKKQLAAITSTCAADSENLKTKSPAFSKPSIAITTSSEQALTEKSEADECLISPRSCSDRAKTPVGMVPDRQEGRASPRRSVDLSNYSEDPDRITYPERKQKFVEDGNVSMPSSESEFNPLDASTARRCYMWYARLGQPTKEEMLKRVTALPYGSDITTEDVERLPWTNNDSMLNVHKMNKLFLLDNADAPAYGVAQLSHIGSKDAGQIPIDVRHITNATEDTSPARLINEDSTKSSSEKEKIAESVCRVNNVDITLPDSEAEDTLSSTIVGKKAELDEETKKKCYMWYARMGQPTRKEMIRRVNNMPSSCGITQEDVELLPWVAGGHFLKVHDMNKLFLEG